MHVLERFFCQADNAVGFVIPLFCRHPGANLFQVQVLDGYSRIRAFEDIVREPRLERRADRTLAVEIGDPAIWAFLDEDGEMHVGTKNELRQSAPKLLSPELIQRCPASAADLIRLCDLEDVMPKIVRKVYTVMTRQIGEGATIWRDTDLILPLIRKYFSGRFGSKINRVLLSRIWVQSIGETCHIFCPATLVGRGETDLSEIAKIASAWGIKFFNVHPQEATVPRKEKHVDTWSVVGYGGVGRWTVHRMGNAIRPLLVADWAHVESNALEGRLVIPSAALPGSSAPPKVHIVIHGSSRNDVEAGRRLFGEKQSDVIRHVFNIRPLGSDPERRQAVPVRAIFEDKHGPDYVWVIANHRSRRMGTHYVGLARSQIASRFARAGISALADLCFSSLGRKLLQGTAGERGIGLVGATRYLTEMGMQGLLVRVLYSMLSPEWTFSDNVRLVCLWPHPLPEESFEYVEIGSYRYLVEMIGLQQSSARADVRCLAFGVSATPSGVEPYAEYVATVMAAWGWNLRGKDGEAMIFKAEGEIISMLIADTPARLDAILRRDHNVGPIIDIVVTKKSLSKVQKHLAETGGWPVVHHSDLPSWIQHELGEPGEMPVGGRNFPLE